MPDPQPVPRSAARGDGEHVAIRGVHFPLEQPESRLRRLLKIVLGGLLCLLRPAQRERLIRGEPEREQLRLTDRLIVAALVWHHRRRGTLGALSGLHRWLWRGQQAVSLHAQTEARFRSWWLDHHSAVIAPLQEAMARLAAEGQPVRTLCEIGCGSGAVLADIASRLPALDRLVGLDLSAAQVAANRARGGQDPRLQFEVADALSWLPANAAPGWAYLTNGGVLEYFSETMLEDLLGGIARRHPPALFALVEPIADDYDLDRETASRPYNAEMSLGHNYPYWLRRCGWEVLHQQRQDVGSTRWLLVVAATAKRGTA